MFRDERVQAPRLPAPAALRRTTRRNRRGFTLVELVIVASLIALFSGLAIFGVQQQFENNRRKATIAETRQIATSLDLANLDVSIFPKLCWLEQSESGLRFIGQQLFGGGGNEFEIYNYMDIQSRSTFSQGFGISQNWRGAYFAISQARRGAAQGQGGYVQMILPELEGLPSGADGYRWPADPYGNPYVLYMLNLDLTNPGNAVLYFINEDTDASGNQDPGAKGEYINAIVSYGMNRIPGGGDRIRVNMNDSSNVSGRRLYTQANPNQNIARYLDELEFNRARANVWNAEFNANLGGGALATDNDGTGPVGITDIGSDDIIFEF